MWWWWRPLYSLVGNTLNAANRLLVIRSRNYIKITVLHQALEWKTVYHMDSKATASVPNLPDLSTFIVCFFWKGFIRCRWCFRAWRLKHVLIYTGCTRHNLPAGVCIHCFASKKKNTFDFAYDCLDLIGDNIML